ncbi:hypothetical protein B0H11DRAFT_2285924 [Mycena galericulata]|nr:hypothetical protein B0H11DRAFT_2285924 [Mycena galericulata]
MKEYVKSTAFGAITLAIAVDPEHLIAVQAQPPAPGEIQYTLPNRSGTDTPRLDDLDTLLNGHGFSEATIVDLDLHQPGQSRFDDYGYDSDSDLDSEEDDEGEVKGYEMVAVVLKDTAFKAWKALLYYCYTGRVNFRPLKSEGSKDSLIDGPSYRARQTAGLALASISSRLSELNILREVFSSFTFVCVRTFRSYFVPGSTNSLTVFHRKYPVIQELEVGVLTSNFSEKASEGLE